MNELQDWLDTPAFYAVLVLVLLCLALVFRHTRGDHKNEEPPPHTPPRKRRTFWHRR